MKNTIHNKACAGFSLVEMALALLIAGLGVLTVFNLFPQGLDASRKSVDASEISMFGDYVFDSLHLDALVLAPSNSWNQFANNQTYGRTPQSHAMQFSSGTQNVVRAAGNGIAGVQVFSLVPNYYHSLGSDSKYSFSSFTYTLDIGSLANFTKYARLEVWPGDKRQAVVNAITSGSKLPGSVVFYREFVPRYL